MGGNPTNGPSPFQWYDATDEQLGKYWDTIRPLSSLGGPAARYGLLPPNDELTLRLQTYVDDIDGYVRKADPELTQYTPHPKVRIYEDPTFLNAWASGVPVCIASRVIFGDPEQPSSGREYFSVLLHHNSVRPLEETKWVFGRPPQKLEDCITAPSSSQLAAFVTWMNSKRGSCRYALEGDAIRVSGPSCAIGGAKKDFAGARTARYHAVIPQVFIAVGFLKFIEDEAQIVGVLAHELGHFYKSHSTNADYTLSNESNIFSVEPLQALEHPAGSYNYFTTQPRNPEAGRPRPREDSPSIRDQVLKFGPNQANPFKGISGLTLDPSMARFVLSSVGNTLPGFCAAASCDPSCAEAAKQYSDHGLYDLIFTQQLTADQKTAYRQIEALFLQCSRSIEVSAPSTPGALSLEKVRSAFSTPMERQDPELPSGGSLNAIVLALNEQMKVYAQKEEAFYDFLDREHVGFYTAEQEADELAAEFLANIGVDPLDHARLDLKGGRTREQEAPETFLQVNRISMDRCARLFDSDFIDPETGEYVFVPLGDLTGTHHGPCYRAFNSRREIEAHGYTAVPVSRSFDKPWSYFLELLKSLR